MNSVAPSAPAQRLQLARERLVDVELHPPAAKARHRRPRPVRRQLQRRQLRQRRLPVRRAAAPAPRPAATPAATPHSPRTAPATAATARASPRQRAPYSADSSRTSTPDDQPSVMMWCSVSSSQCSSSRKRSSRARTSGPCSRSNGACASSCARRRASASRSSGGKAPRSSTANARRSSAAITCTGSPVLETKARAQRLVACHHLVQRRLQRRNVQRTNQPEHASARCTPTPSAATDPATTAAAAQRTGGRRKLPAMPRPRAHERPRCLGSM